MTRRSKGQGRPATATPLVGAGRAWSPRRGRSARAGRVGAAVGPAAFTVPGVLVGPDALGVVRLVPEV
jgi:hypothetical protein